MKPLPGKQNKVFIIIAAAAMSLFFVIFWAGVSAFVPSGLGLNIINFILYPVSLSIVGLAAYVTLKLYMNTKNAVIGSLIIWAVMIFPVKALLTFLIKAVFTG
jgi:hypothetical protein